MKRVNGMVSDDAKEVLINWKKMQQVTTLDEALDDILLRVGKQMTAWRKEEANHIDDLMTGDLE